MSDTTAYDIGLKITGAMSLTELRKSQCYKLPSQDRVALAAVIECIEEIPCNPCETACPQHAITIGSEITTVPVVNLDLCNGCGLCVAACPGLAIYLKKFAFKPSLAYISFTFEYFPPPKKDDVISMVDRFGNVVCEGLVVKVVNIAKNDKTVIVHATYPNEYYEEVVNMKRLPR